MNKPILFLAALVMALCLAGCDSPSQSQGHSADLQTAADLAEQARAYADARFRDSLSREPGADYEIEGTNYGFISADPVVFVVGYQYTVQNTQYLYGYKLGLSEDLTFSVLEEGESVGELICGR